MYGLKDVKGRALPYDPTILLLNIQLEDLKQVCQKGICLPGFNVALFTAPETHILPKCPSADV